MQYSLAIFFFIDLSEMQYTLAAHGMGFLMDMYSLRLFIESYRNYLQTRHLFTIWAFAQLLKFYLNMLPDLDLMFNGNDTPVINGKHNTTPPPFFRLWEPGHVRYTIS